MKISFICPEISQGGGSRVIAAYALELLSRGHDVQVVARLPKQDSQLRRAWSKLRSTGMTPLENRDLFFRPLGNRLTLLPNKWPLDIDDVPDGDVIVATWWRTAFEVMAMPPEKGKKAYFIQHHEVHPHLPTDLSAGSYYLPIKKITIADWLVQTMANTYGDDNVALVPNAVDSVKFNAPPRDRNARPKVGLMYASTPFKGLDVMIKAVNIARDALPDLDVAAFGKRDPEDEYPLPPNTQYLREPPQEQIPALYASCDAWVFGSRNEGFGLPLLEAMACRTPVVATRAGAAPDLIKPGVNGYLADIDDAEALGARLIELLSHPADTWRAMSEAARETVASYTWADATDAFETELLNIAGAS
ncbi:MAG: glycosyltransferase family 4 protein [Pseudomonadota bacterium]